MSRQDIIPDHFVNIAEDCSQNTKWIKSQIRLGKGVAGDTFICDRHGCEFALKVQKTGKIFKREVTALSELQGIRGVPNLYAAWTCNGLGYFVIDLLYPCENIPLHDQWIILNRILKDIHDRDYVHGDPHMDNLLCDREGNVTLIDYGYAQKFPGKHGFSITTPTAKREKRPISFDDLVAEETRVMNDSFPVPKEISDASTLEFYKRFRPELLQSGLIAEINKMTVPSLRHKLKKLDLSTEGNKDELQKRLLSHLQN